MPTWMGLEDLIALVWFLTVWSGYTIYADHSPAHARSISAAMNRHRASWMTAAARRDLRMIDTNILGNLLTGVGFFASTTIFVIGGLIAMLGVTGEAAQAIARLPFAPDQPLVALEFKTLGLLGIFIYAFFKFAWAFRLANYCSILVGTFPDSTLADTDQARNAVRIATVLSCRSGHHFNRGLRAYFFALAALGWMVSPVIFAILTAGVLIVLYRREFKSRAFVATAS